MKNILKFRLLLVSLLLFIWSFIVESPFQKGGIDSAMHYVIFFLTALIGYVFLLPYSYPKFILAEKIFYSLVTSCIGLISGGFLTGSILDFFYNGDYELKSDPVISNLIFYFSTNIFGLGLLSVIIKLKNRT